MSSLKIVGRVVVAFIAAAAPARAQELIWTQERVPWAEFFGGAVSFIEDWNGDGRVDVVIGAYGTQCSGSDTGTSDGNIEVRDGVTGSPLLLQWCGNEDGAGVVVVPVRDVDGDGKQDIIVSCPYFDDPVGGRDQGRIVMLSSASGLPLWELIGEQDGDHFGAPLVRLGDLDGDGFDDLLVSAMFQGTLGKGRVYVVSTRDGTTIRIHSGTITNEKLGSVICACGDVDGDDVVDYAVTGVFDYGRLQVNLYSGAAGSLIWTRIGEKFDGFGTTMQAADDWNRDGHDDLLVLLSGIGDGVLRIYSPATDQLLFELSYQPLHNTGDYWGRVLTHIGDLDSDGFVDFAISAWADKNPILDTGRVDFYSGRTMRPLYHLYPKNFNKGWFGLGTAGGHDLNGDGIPDLVVGAPIDRPTSPQGGKVFVYALNDLYLMTDSETPLAGDTVVVDLRAGPPGLFGLIALTDISGTPLFAPLLLAPFDANGELQLCADVDASVSGLDFTLRGYAQNRAGRGPLMDSIDVTVSVQ